MRDVIVSTVIPNRINSEEQRTAKFFKKINPATEEVLFQVARSGENDVQLAVKSAKAAQSGWADLSSVARGKLLLNIARLMEEKKSLIAEVVAQETGKSVKDALGETGGAIQLAEFFAGEGMRLYGRSLNSGIADKITMTVREPHGVAALIIAANTPIANVAWKVFPALICGNTVVLKAAEDTPATADIFASIAFEAGLPTGVLNVIQGYGHECGEFLVRHPEVDVISFTGSTRVGKVVASIAAENLKRVSLELGGKNPIVICCDADIEKAVNWTVLSAFSNAGQRCAAASRILVFNDIYEEFKEKLLAKTKELTLGTKDDNDLGPVINKRQLDNMLAAIEDVTSRGATILCGGSRLKSSGYFMRPTILENVSEKDQLNSQELFGPIASLHRVIDLQHAIDLSNNTVYGLTAAIHTQNINTALKYTRAARVGAVNVNAGTYGSEPHYPFGGFGASGNGTREPGVEALDVYSETKTISTIIF